MAVDASAKPGLPPLVLIAASAGGVNAIATVLQALPRTFDAAVVIVLHRSPTYPTLLKEILERVSPLPVQEAFTDAPIQAGHIYVARPDQHLVIRASGRFAYEDGQRIRHVRSSANPLFETAAAIFKGRTIGVVLTGHGTDATDGVQAVRRHGGLIVTQDPHEAEAAGMPQSAINTGVVDYIVGLRAVAPLLVKLVSAAQPAPAESESAGGHTFAPTTMAEPTPKA